MSATPMSATTASATTATDTTASATTATDTPATDTPNARQLATVLLAIDGRKAARILHGLSPEQFRSVTQAMTELRREPLDSGDTQQALAAVARLLANEDSTAELTEQPAESPNEPRRRTLEEVVPPRGEASAVATASLRQASPQPTESVDLTVIEQLSAEDLRDVLVDEHPQLVAVILVHMSRAKAAGVLRVMGAERRAALLHRIATLGRFPEGLVARLATTLETKIDALGLRAARPEPQQAVRAAAEILKHLEGEDEILQSIGSRDELTADSIRDELVTFADLARFDRRSIQRLLSCVETSTLAVAMKGADPDVEQNIADNLSKRAHDMLSQVRERLGPIPLSKVRACQDRILRLARQLIARGKLRKPYARVEPML